MEYQIKIEQKYLGLPIAAEQPEELLEIFCEGEKLYEFQIPVRPQDDGQPCDFYSYLNLKAYEGKTLTLRGNFRPEFFAQLRQSECSGQEPLTRPLLHFTAERGWINDPNGLVYHDGRYHLFFQYNPMNTEWQNMSWGHAVSSDLLHFKQTETAMWPDEHGAVYSGCGLVNERGLLGLPKDALLFYYSAAGDINPWSKGKKFTQRIAYSTDGGDTLVKLPVPAVDVIEADSRDPKVFWHEETQAYIMVLWIQGYEFGFLRSENLQDWELTGRITLDKAWECPDLFRLECDGEAVWVFTSADGFYYFGSFDGYQFRTDGVQHRAYQTGLPYAAQTFSGTDGRTVSVPWLRTKNAGRLYTGMMGLPRELSVVRRGGEKCLSLLPVREYENGKSLQQEFAWAEDGFEAETDKDAVTELYLVPDGPDGLEVQFFGQSLSVRDNVIFYKNEKTVLSERLEEIHIIIDRGILEVYGNAGTQNAWYETDSDLLCGRITVSGGRGKGNIYTFQES